MATSGYITDEAEYTKYTQHTIGAATYPTTGDNWDTWNDFFSDVLNSKIGVSANITDDPPLKICKWIVATWIRRLGLLEEARNQYASPEERITVLPSMIDTTPENEFIADILGYLDNESEPAYWTDMGSYYSGSYLQS